MAAIPNDCPVCGGDKVEHHPANISIYEWARYECGAEILLLENGKLEANKQCGTRILDNMLRKLNTT